MQLLTKRSVIYLLLLLSFSFSQLKAQDQFTVYSHIAHAYDNPIMISSKYGQFSLWISAMHSGSEFEAGGLVVKESMYKQFYNGIKTAKAEYHKWINDTTEQKFKKGLKPLNIEIQTDAYFRDQTLHYHNTAFLSLSLEKSPDNADTCFLVIRTGELKSTTNNNIRSAGFKIIFSSENEIENFLQKISPDSINKYMGNAVGNLSKINDREAPANIKASKERKWVGHVEAGIKGIAFTSYKTNQPELTIISYTGCGLGLFERYYIGRVLFQPELILNREWGESSEEYIDYFSQTPSTRIELFLSHHISTPVLVGYNVFYSDKIRINALAGLQPRFNVYKNKKVQGGFAVGADIDYSMLSLGLRYNYFRDIYKSVYGTIVIEDNMLSNLSVHLAWKFYKSK